MTTEPQMCFDDISNKPELAKRMAKRAEKSPAMDAVPQIKTRARKSRLGAFTLTII